MQTRVYAVPAAKQPLGPSTIERRAVGPNDVQIDILFCGICHSDIHQARDEWGNAASSRWCRATRSSAASRASARTSQKVKVGDLAGVGCMVDSCGDCTSCREGYEQFCERGSASTYNGTEMDRKTPTYGGYAQQIVVTEQFVLKVPEPASIPPAPRRSSAPASRRTRR